MKRISACMIVKNEEEYIEDCLKSIVDYVDEIIIVDTGSSDGTKHLVMNYTHNVYDYPFNNDFANARNYSLEKSTGDWNLVIDADERMNKKNFEQLRSFIDSCDSEIAGIRMTKYNFFKNGAWYISTAMRFFRNLPDIKFEGEVNESVSGSIKELGFKMIELPIYINHIGHTKSFLSRQKKNQFYLEIFNKRLEKTPDDVNLKAYVALLYRAYGLVGKGVQKIEEICGCQSAKESFSFQLFAGHVYKAAQNMEKAKEYYTNALELTKNDPIAYSNLGVANICLRQFDTAIDVLKEGIEKNSCAWFLYVNLGLAYQYKGQYDMAIKYFDISIENNEYFEYEHPLGKFEEDPYRIFYFETIPHYAGIRYHRGYCLEKLRNI